MEFPSGLIFDDSPHYLDHLAPFCSLMKWPLIIAEPSIADLARAYYPNLNIVETISTLPSHLVVCDPLPLVQSAIPNWKNPTFWLPHGNSDKGWKSPFFEALQSETAALVYGQKIIDFMKAKNVPIPFHRIGNFRRLYWEQHKQFYQNQLKEKIRTNRKTALYAPTWDDSEENGTFWKHFPELAEALPKDHNLIVKLHPNTVKKYEAKLQPIYGKYEQENILFLDEFPPIYPLLSLCDLYIGDMSSIGYDFLFFNRPMVFLNPNQHRDLHRCGTVILPGQIHSIFKPKPDLHSKIRKQTYDYTFDPTPNWTELDHALRSL